MTDRDPAPEGGQLLLCRRVGRAKTKIHHNPRPGTKVARTEPWHCTRIRSCLRISAGSGEQDRPAAVASVLRSSAPAEVFLCFDSTGPEKTVPILLRLDAKPTILAGPLHRVWLGLFPLPSGRLAPLCSLTPLRGTWQTSRKEHSPGGLDTISGPEPEACRTTTAPIDIVPPRGHDLFDPFVAQWSRNPEISTDFDGKKFRFFPGHRYYPADVFLGVSPEGEQCK